MKKGTVELGEWAKPRDLEPPSLAGTQYEAGVILERLQDIFDQRSVCTIALIREDLYLSENESLDYVPGAVDQRHRVGLFSAARYYLADFDCNEDRKPSKISACMIKML